MDRSRAADHRDRRPPVLEDELPVMQDGPVRLRDRQSVRAESGTPAGGRTHLGKPGQISDQAEAQAEQMRGDLVDALAAASPLATVSARSTTSSGTSPARPAIAVAGGGIASDCSCGSRRLTHRPSDTLHPGSAS